MSKDEMKKVITISKKNHRDKLISADDFDVLINRMCEIAAIKAFLDTHDLIEKRILDNECYRVVSNNKTIDVYLKQVA